jgi:BMFP domain-containing protein YqiC
MDLVGRDEFEAMKLLAARAQEEVATLKERLAALEERLASGPR